MMSVLSDAAARQAIIERLDDNMVVEAGAGTGKTKSLVDRVVALIATGHAVVGRIAAITFTEAAAAELRARIGEALERASSDTTRQQVERERCKRAVDDLDQASIQTLHSFAGSLLRERPLEVGLPPGFGIRDEIEAGLALEEKWSEWIDAQLDDPDAQEALRPVLQENVTLQNIRDVAFEFNKNYDLLTDVSFATPSEEAPEDAPGVDVVPLLELLRRFALDYADERRYSGEIEFQDLLTLARDLLRDSVSARDHFRDRYSHILIDEVQDTDPLQAEIAMFLAEDAPDAVEPSLRPKDWRKAQPSAGKLFIVGDAKQSIYRFRRADIRQVKRMQEAVGGVNVLLTQNFRSQSPVIDWVNHLFDQWMQESEGQAGYSPLVAGPGDGESPPVRFIGGETGGGIDDIRREEAESIVRTIRSAVDDGWLIRSEGAGTQTRPARFQDVCVLMPTRTGLNTLEIAFENAAVPYRLDSAGLIYESQETKDLLNCLLAIDDPTDQVSVAAALRSPALACSDADLLEFVESGGQFDYLSDDEPPPGYTADALAVLRDFHQRSRWKSPAALIEEFVREGRLFELALDSWQWRTRWMRCQFLIDRARAFAASSDSSLRAYLAWSLSQRGENARARESVIPGSDEDAVRIMTVHVAKGLEFPIVVLTGLNSERRPNRDSVLFDRERGQVEAKLGSELRTLGFENMRKADKEREEEETVRLMYVAATRARDHLVVSMYRKEGEKTKPPAHRINAYMEEASHLWQPFKPPSPNKQISPEYRAETDAVDGDSPAYRRRWIEQRNGVYATRSRPISVAATRLAQEAKDEQDIPDEPWRRGRAGTNFGRAVHAVLQVVDLRTGDGLEDIANAQAAAEGVPGRARDIANLVHRALDNPLVKRALDSGRWWRETPVAGPVGEGIVEGFIDLLFEEEDGFVIVDYKTDTLGSQDEIDRAMARYRLQGGGYALALNRATGATVKEASFLFLQPSRVETVRDLSGAMREAEDRALALFAGGTAH